jgi:uncharacterized protein with HEPN domain
MTPDALSDQHLIAYMLDCMARIREYTEGDRTVFFGSRLVQDATIHNLQTLAEAGQRLSDGLRARETAIDWRRMVGMRNILVRASLGCLDLETVWATVERNLPGLEQALQRQRHRLAQGDGGGATSSGSTTSGQGARRHPMRANASATTEVGAPPSARSSRLRGSPKRA